MIAKSLYPFSKTAIANCFEELDNMITPIKPKTPPVVAFCADKNMEAGLHVALFSLLSNYSEKNSGIKLELFLQGYSSRDLDLLRVTVDRTSVNCVLNISKISLDLFSSFRSLHGNYMPYARLALADILKDEGKILYLDSDLVISADIRGLLMTEMGDYALGAVIGGKMEYSLERSFFIEMGLNLNGPYFNSGVLLFNAAKWRQNNLTNECIAFCNKYPHQLRAADQTVLNVILHQKVLGLDNCYNYPCYPNDPLLDLGKTKNHIIHFVGSPKPWDMFGGLLIANHTLFKSYLCKTAFRGNSSFNLQRLSRTWNTRRSYFRVLLNKYKSKTSAMR